MMKVGSPPPPRPHTAQQTGPKHTALMNLKPALNGFTLPTYMPMPFCGHMARPPQRTGCLSMLMQALANSFWVFDTPTLSSMVLVFWVPRQVIWHTSKVMDTIGHHAIFTRHYQGITSIALLTCCTAPNITTHGEVHVDASLYIVRFCSRMQSCGGLYRSITSSSCYSWNRYGSLYRCDFMRWSVR